MEWVGEYTGSELRFDHCQSFHHPPPSPESVLRPDSPSKVIKLDAVRVIAEKVSRALPGLPPL